MGEVAGRSVPGAPAGTPQAGVPSPEISSYPVRTGNALEPLIDGEPAFRRLCEATSTCPRSSTACDRRCCEVLNRTRPPAAGKIPGPLAALGAFETFTLAGLAGQDRDGHRRPVWIHSKLMIVDGQWATVGSCNLHRASLFGNAELNAAFWDPDAARGLLCELLREHLETDVSSMDDLAALKLFGHRQNQQSSAGDRPVILARHRFTLPA
jgi:hypothetical protein